MKHILSMLLLAFVLGTIAALPASAQKAQKTQKKETTPPSPSSIKDVLSQYTGKTTNLGTLKRITGDYFVVEDDGTTMIHPLSTIHTLKLVKDDESGEIKLEIRLTARD